MGKPVTTIVDRVWVVFGSGFVRFHNVFKVYDNDETRKAWEGDIGLIKPIG